MKAFSRTPRPSRSRRLGLAGAGTGAALAAASSAQAAVILAPTVVVSNSMGEYSSDADIGNAIDQSGLSTSYITGVTNYATYLASSPTHFSAGGHDLFWRSDNGTVTGSIIFDLGDLYSVERLAIWQGESSGAKSSTPNVNGIILESSQDLAFSSPSALGSFNVDRGLNATAYPVNDLDLTDSVGRYIRLTITSNYGNPVRSSFGEIAFGVNSVPEPSIPLLLGPALVAVLLKRRRPRLPA